MENSEEIKLPVPYFTQTTVITDEFWKDKTCGIVCFKMALDFLKPENKVSADQLLEEGQIIGGYKDGLWLHDSICRLARNHGLLAYSQEFRSVVVDLNKKDCKPNEETEEKFTKEVLEKIAQEIKNGLPLVISVAPGFSFNKQPHMVLVVGVKIENGEVVGLFVHDPDDRDGQHKEAVFVDLDHFKKHWRRFAIFFEKTA